MQEGAFVSQLQTGLASQSEPRLANFKSGAAIGAQVHISGRCHADFCHMHSLQANDEGTENLHETVQGLPQP